MATEEEAGKQEHEPPPSDEDLLRLARTKLEHIQQEIQQVTQILQVL